MDKGLKTLQCTGRRRGAATDIDECFDDSTSDDSSFDDSCSDDSFSDDSSLGPDLD